jgi:NADPH-dependent 2,4-dienoyl-CoA reductase/sulfur reductase-like enzyme
MTYCKRKRHHAQRCLFTILTLPAVAFHATTSNSKPNLSIRGASSSVESQALDCDCIKRRVVIIGAGVGGLASAARIAAETKKWEDGEVEVVVVEKNGKDMIGSFLDIEFTDSPSL